MLPLFLCLLIYLSLPLLGKLLAETLVFKESPKKEHDGLSDLIVQRHFSDWK